MNRVLMQWKEFGAEGAASVKDCFEKQPYYGQKAITRYLRNGKVKLTAPGCSYDAFTKEMISNRMEILTDGEYSWPSELAYYVEKYNMRLPKRFENKVLGTSV